MLRKELIIKETWPVLFVVTALGLALSVVCSGKTITVNVAGGANFTTIQAAISYPGTNNGDKIEVAPGTYYEAVDFLGKTIHLYSNDGPILTIINGTGQLHVVKCVNGEGPGTIIEGFTITGGNANGSWPHNDRGGGMYNSGSSPTVTGCTFSGNLAAKYGGGMYNDNSSPTVIDCIFSENSANNGSGMYNFDCSPTVANCTFSDNSDGGLLSCGGSPTITNCVFIGNYGYGLANDQSCSSVTNCTFSDNSSSGMFNFNNSSPSVTNCTFSGNLDKGMFNYQSNPTVINCTFSGNSINGMHNETNSNPDVVDCAFLGNSGSGMRNEAGTMPTVINCIFQGNTSARSHGGGMYNISSSPAVFNCTFNENSAYLEGGGMYNETNSSPIVIGCIFSGNISTTSGGGGMFNIYNSCPTVTGCTFVGNGNSAMKYGGGMFNGVNSSPTVINCTFRENSSLRGGGMYNYSSSNPVVVNCTFNGNLCNVGGGMYNSYSSPSVTNCIFWNDTPVELFISYSTPTVTYSDVKGGWNGLGNIDVDPLFANEADGDLHLLSGSPCIDAGDNLAMPAYIKTDHEGNPRIEDSNNDGTSIIDMGAYEIVFCPIYNVTKDSFYHTIQSAINNADLGDKIIVPEGIYKEHISFEGKDITVCSIDPQNWSVVVNTVLQGDGQGAVVFFEGTESTDCLLRGFTVTGGGVSSESPAGPSLDAWWKFDQLNGANAPDSSGHDHHGILVNFADPSNSWVAGKIGNCLTFDGQNDYLEVTDYYGIGGNGARTVCAWINRSAAGVVQTFFSYGCSVSRGNWLFMVNADNKLQLGVNNGNIIGNPVLATDRWYHVAVVLDDWDGDGLKVEDLRLYIDGKQVTGSYFYPDEAINTGSVFPVRIGTHSTVTNFFHGRIDDVRFYSRALVGAEIQAIYSQRGGICGNGTQAAVSNCIIRDNETLLDGGGIWNVDGKITNCFIVNNTSEAGGGGLADCDGLIANCVITENEAAWGGALSSCLAEIVNCGIVGNTALAGGILDACNGTITNCILWNNTGVLFEDSVPPAYSCFPEAGGSNNVSADPAFRSVSDLKGPDQTWGTEDDGLVLQGSSPCIDAGDNSMVPSAITTDITGYLRYIDGNCDTTKIVDMGPTEYNHRYVGDLNDDCVVNLLDFDVLSVNWGNSEGYAGVAIGYGIGQVDLQDLAILTAHWLEITE